MVSSQAVKKPRLDTLKHAWCRYAQVRPTQDQLVSVWHRKLITGIIQDQV
jgi:hypothetical protein